jgi:hypothetical protein
MTMGNLHSVMKQKQRELRPRKRRVGKMGTHTVGVKPSTVGAYEY